MKLRDYYNQIRQSSSGTLVALAAVVVVWILVLAVIVAGIVFYFERPNLAQPGTPTAQTIALDPTAGPAGTPVTVIGQGWAANSIVSIFLLAPGQTQIPNFATTQATVDTQGLFTTAVAIPLDSVWLAPGTAQVIAEVSGGGASARAAFVVLPTTPTPAITSTITETPALTQTPVLAPTETGTPTPLPTSTPGPATAIANTAVNVRLGPGTNYPVIGTLLAGQSAGITGVSSDGAWWQINFAAGTGWVSSFFVVAQNTQNVPIVAPPPLPPTPVPVPQAPLAVIGIFNQGPTGQVITFDGSASRASQGHNLVAFAWNFGDGITANGVIVSHSYGQPGNYVVTLTVTDDQGLTAEATQTVQFRQLPPIPIIGGPNRGTVGDSVTFDGSQSIANTGIIVDYEWDFGDGTTASEVTVDHTYDQPGRYRVVLRTTNSVGLSASADHDIRIEGQPVAIINAPSQGQVGQLITFYGSSSNTNNIVRFAWSFGDGTYANGQTVTHAYAQPGNFVVTLTVTNRGGLSDTATRTIAISQAAQPPTAVIKATNQGTAGQPLTFDGSSSAPGSGQIVSFAWSFGDGTNASGPVVTHVYAQPGTYTIVLNVTNSNNLTATATETIAISQAAQPPTAVINAPGQGTAGQPVSFDGSGSTPGSGQIVSFAWSFGDGTNASGPVVTHVYANAGNYIITLKVTNSSNQTASTTRAIAIGQAAQPPKAIIKATNQGQAGQPLTFDGSSSAPGSGQIVSFAWSFGDGTNASGPVVSHAYANAGNYTVSLEVTNSSNQTASATQAITISQAAQPPTAVINAPGQGTAGQPVSFDGSGSTPGSGQIVKYDWTFGDGATGSGATVSHVYANAGNYTVTLKVTNSSNQIANATHAIAIGQAAQPPKAIIKATSQGTAGQPLTFDGSGSTPGSGQIVSYAWDFGDGATGSGATVSHVYANAGTYTVTLKVTNSSNQTASAAQAITISQAAQPPTAAINAPGQGIEGQPVSFDGSGSTPGSGQIVKYDWTFGDGATGSGATVSHVYANAGTYTVTLKVTNSSNQIASTTRAIVIGQAVKPPKAVIDAPNEGQVGRSITFDGSHSTAGGQITSYAWNFGDGAAGNGATVSHAYANAGTYTVSLTVTSDTGQTASATHTIRIEGNQTQPLLPGGGQPSQPGGGANPPSGGTPPNAGNPPGGGTPPFGGGNPLFGGGQGGLRAVISAPPAGRVNQPITFDGSRSTASGGQIASYAWTFGDGTTGSGATVSHAYARAGLYVVTLTVTDSRGQTATASQGVIIP